MSKSNDIVLHNSVGDIKNVKLNWGSFGVDLTPRMKISPPWPQIGLISEKTGIGAEKP